jgi:uncharacterized protein
VSVAVADLPCPCPDPDRDTVGIGHDSRTIHSTENRSSSPPPTSVPSTPSPEVPECTACGACCFSTLPEYVRVFGCDMDRMDDEALQYTDFLGHQCFLRIEDGHCAALQIDPGDPGRPGSQPRFTCAIYDMRPDVCRSLERGSGACRADRHEKAERPLIAVETLLRARPPLGS